jgi:phosphoserine aminotransferase
MTRLSGRLHNFSAGPGVLPVPVLEQVQAELLNYPGAGMSVMEMSHRSAPFEAILNTAEADLRALLGIPAHYKVLFLQGGATQQFAMVPMNLRPAGASADYILSGAWGQGAFKEARKLGKARAAASLEADHYTRLPAQKELDLDPAAAYLHMTSNETIHGVEWPAGGEPLPPVGVPLVCDMSSDIASRPVDVSKYALIYAGAQKNLGPAGVTLVIVREDLLARTPAGLPIVLDYKLQAEHKSLFNTPPTFVIYVLGKVLHWLRELGGLEAMGQRNERKAALLYRTIDRSGGFYTGNARPEARSRMNATFHLPTAALDQEFVATATAEGLDGLKGHRVLGGLRASLYNAQPYEAVEALTQFMQEFQRKNG